MSGPFATAEEIKKAGYSDVLCGSIHNAPITDHDVIIKAIAQENQPAGPDKSRSMLP